MPQISIVFYQDEDGACPVLEWLDGQDEKVQNKLSAVIEMLRERGHELHRPQAAYLRDDIYELRVRYQNVHYRILYFFHDRLCAVLAHGIKKKSRIPDRGFNVAVRRKGLFQGDPLGHSHTGES